MKLITSLSTLALIAALAVNSPADEKNGIMATVSKKTIERGDTNVGYYSKTDRTQGLALDVKNTSIREFPEGEVRWTVVVRRSYEGGLEKMAGKEKLKPLKSSQQVQLIFGAAQVGGYRTDYRNYKDKVEYEVVITHAGKETMRLSSTPGFAALASRATNRERERGDGEDERPAKGEGEGDKPKKEEGDKPAIAKGGGEKPMPKGSGDKPMPAKPDATPTAKGDGEKSMPPKGDTPPKGDADKPAEEPAAKPFDFFNLDKTKKSQPAEK